MNVLIKMYLLDFVYLLTEVTPLFIPLFHGPHKGFQFCCGQRVTEVISGLLFVPLQEEQLQRCRHLLGLCVNLYSEHVDLDREKINR